MFLLVHVTFRGLFTFFPLGVTFLSLSFMKHTIMHNSLNVNPIIIPLFPTCYSDGRFRVNPQAIS